MGLLEAYHRAKQRSLARCNSQNHIWNNDPNGGAWTGYDLLVARMHRGEPMVAGVCVDPRTPWQYQRYNWLQNEAIRLGYERRPPAPHGASCLHLHFEHTSPKEGDSNQDDQVE